MQHLLCQHEVFPKNATKHLCFGKFPKCSNFLLCHRHFHYDDIMIIMLYGSSNNCIMPPIANVALHALKPELSHAGEAYPVRRARSTFSSVEQLISIYSLVC